MFGEFDDVAMYLRELQGQPYYALLPLQQAADTLGLSRAGVAQRIRANKLDGVRVGRTIYACAMSVLAIMDNERKHATTIKAFLEKVAHKGETTNYSEVMPLVGLSPKIPNDRLVIGKLLGLVSRESNVGKSPVLLTALVFNQSLNRPSDAFFNLAYEEDYKDAYEDKFLAKHIRRIHRKYQ